MAVSHSPNHLRLIALVLFSRVGTSCELVAINSCHLRTYLQLKSSKEEHETSRAWSNMVKFTFKIGYKFYWFMVTTGYCYQQCSAPKTVYDLAFHSHPKGVHLSIVKALVRDEKTVKVSILDIEIQPTPKYICY